MAGDRDKKMIGAGGGEPTEDKVISELFSQDQYFNGVRQRGIN